MNVLENLFNSQYSGGEVILIDVFVDQMTEVMLSSVCQLLLLVMVYFMWQDFLIQGSEQVKNLLVRTSDSLIRSYKKPL